MRYLVYTLLLLILVSCTPKPQTINYGADACNFCRMTIVDAQHAAELVSTKGKAYKFDAIECMVQYLQDNKEQTYAFQLVNNYLEAGQLIDATQSTFLVSPNIPSPMGANLSAFENKTVATEWQEEKSGDIYNWIELQAHLNK